MRVSRRGGAVAVDLNNGKVLWHFEPVLDYTGNSVRSIWTSHAGPAAWGWTRTTSIRPTAATCSPLIARAGPGCGIASFATQTRELGPNAARVRALARLSSGFKMASAAQGEVTQLHLTRKAATELWRFYTVPGDPSKPSRTLRWRSQQRPGEPIIGRSLRRVAGAAGVWDE